MGRIVLVIDVPPSFLSHGPPPHFMVSFSLVVVVVVVVDVVLLREARFRFGCSSCGPIIFLFIVEDLSDASGSKTLQFKCTIQDFLSKYKIYFH